MPKTTPTLGLCVITKDWTPELVARLAALKPHFDAFYVQINGSPKPKGRGADWVNFSWYKWSDDFAAARNALAGQVKTDYWCWMDTDDTIRNPERLRTLAALMDQSHTDMLFAPYEYNTTQGVVSELQARERLIRTNLKGEWVGVVHETWIPAGDAVRETTSEVVWVHHPTKDSLTDSMKRNRRILEREIQKDPPDPRHYYYLGLNYGMDGHYREAIAAFEQLTLTSGWDEEIYRAWLQIFSCYFELGDYEQAEMAAFRAMTILPEWPDAYFMLQQLYYQVDDHQKALQWYQVGVSKPEPLSDSAFNPIVRHYQPHELAAYSYLAQGDPEKALKAAVILPPTYQVKPALKTEIRAAVNSSRVITAAKIVMEGVDDPRPVLEALPPEIRSDVRLTAERRKYIPGKKWPFPQGKGKGSIAIYCGPSFEDWGPDTLDKGMGGSEEAIVYLARQLGKTYSVTVFNQRTTSFLDRIGERTVLYLPWTEVNPNDTFDTFVAWRSPAGIENIKARRKLVDLHDIISTEAVYKALPHVDKYLFKSAFHRSLYPEVPDEQAAIIGNGLVREQFK